MKKYIVLLFFIGGCFCVFAQPQKGIDVAKVVRKDASSVTKFSWRDGAYSFKKDNIYRLPFRTLRQRTKTPLRGAIVTKGGDFGIKGYNISPDVVCFAKGVVVSVNDDGIVVDHGNGFESYYGTILSPKVQVGGRVKKGQLIGRLSQEKELLFALRLNGTAIDVDEVFDPLTGLNTYAGNLYIYVINSTVFVSRYEPMALFARNKENINKEFGCYYQKGISDHRAKRDFVDEVIKNAANEEIKLEDVQIGPAKKQDTIRIKNTIIL